MEQRYLPEGRLLDTAANRRLLAGAEGLAAAMERGTIVEGTALRCTPAHDLVVALGPFTGVIPRLEAAAGVAEGTVREVAILSRVGRPVCGVITGLDVDPAGGVRPILSRRLAQERALGHFLAHLSPGDVVPAAITHLKPFGAFVDLGCGVVSLIGIDRLSVSRIPHAALRCPRLLSRPPYRRLPRDISPLFRQICQSRPTRVTFSSPFFTFSATISEIRPPKSQKAPAFFVCLCSLTKISAKTRRFFRASRFIFFFTFPVCMLYY